MTTKATILTAIRTKCLDCSGGQRSEVRECPIRGCALWPFRFGRDPERSPDRGFGKKPVVQASDSDLHAGARQRGSPQIVRQPKPLVYTSDCGQGGSIDGQGPGATRVV